MTPIRLLPAFCLFTAVLLGGQAPSVTGFHQEPSLPVVDLDVCPGEGCTFGKWIVARDSAVFSSWKDDRKPLFTLNKGELVTGLTGVHVTYEPDRIQVLKPIPELHLQAGDIFLRYMLGGEGYADIWVNGEWKKDYDCSFVQEKDGSGCARDCPARVISDGKKGWWVRLKTLKGLIGWTKVEGQFDCMDSLGGDPQCANL